MSKKMYIWRCVTLPGEVVAQNEKSARRKFERLNKGAAVGEIYVYSVA